MYEYRCRVNKVLDGDTVDIDLDLGFNIILSSQRVRMAGVDTPESRTSDKEEDEADQHHQQADGNADDLQG